VPTDPLTDAQQRSVMGLMAMLDDGWSADLSYEAMKGKKDNRPPGDLGKTFELLFLAGSRIVDGNFVDEKGVSHLIQLKASGKLNKSGARAEKLELITAYLGYQNHLGNSVYGDHQIDIHLCTALDGDITAVSPAVRQYWRESELILGRDFRTFVTQLQDGASVVWEAMDNVAGTLGRDVISEIMSQAMAATLSSIAYDSDQIDESIGL